MQTVNNQFNTGSESHSQGRDSRNILVWHEKSKKKLAKTHYRDNIEYRDN